MTIEIGASRTDSVIVGPDHLASAMGNAGVAVLATPTLVLFAETASHQLILPYLKPGQATVGTHVDLRHLKATPLGMRVWITATLRESDRRRRLFEIAGRDEEGPILSGFHERFVVELEPFLAHAGRPRG